MRITIITILILIVGAIVGTLATGSSLAWLWACLVWLVVAAICMLLVGAVMEPDSDRGVANLIWGTGAIILLPTFVVWLFFDETRRDVSATLSLITILLLLISMPRPRGREATKRVAPDLDYSLAMIDPEAARIKSDSKMALNSGDEALARELVGLLGQVSAPDWTHEALRRDSAYGRIREIGGRINNSGGLQSMQSVGYRVGALGGKARLLEICWDGIGEWQE